MTPDEYCQARAAQSGSSFYYSFLFLPPERRRAITALYAFCREVDDIVDNAGDPGVARIKLTWWRGEIGQAFAGAPSHKVMQALAPALEPYALPQEHFLSIIDGMQMDLDQTRYLDRIELELYCHRVAGVVGLLAAAIFGYSNPRTLDYAARLGQALQLTNIIRDVGEDARRGRIYLPQSELHQFGVSAATILRAEYVPGFEALMHFQVEHARRHYAAAMAALPDEDRRNQRPGLIMGAIYGALLTEIERENCRVLHQRIALTPVRKLWIAWKTWVRP
ncbi:MAG: presqualene diphosphate synthase HpnD [Betaproteobacteria bacterium]